MNLRALQLLYPAAGLYGIEINEKAAAELTTVIGNDNVFKGSIFDFASASTYELALIKTVLIHINPDLLPAVYERKIPRP